MAELVSYAVAGSVARLTLDSPHNRNALSSVLVEQVHAGLHRASEDPAGRAVVLPALRRLPEGSVGVEASRSELLAQHVALARASDEAARGAAEDARALARLWALRAKMGAVSAAARARASAAGSGSAASASFSSSFDDDDGGVDETGEIGAVSNSNSNNDGSFIAGGDEYAERGGRVEAAAAALERRLSKAVELLDGSVFFRFFCVFFDFLCVCVPFFVLYFPCLLSFSFSNRR